MIQAYASAPGTDLFLDSRCIVRAQANQSNLLKYDGKTDKHYIIPTSNNTAQITGDYSDIDVLSMTTICPELVTSEYSLAGSVTIGRQFGTDLGHSLSYQGGPYPVSFPDKASYSILATENEGIDFYLSSFSLNLEYPVAPARVSYTWQFSLNCGVDTG